MSALRIAHLSDPHFGTLNEGVQESLLRTLRSLSPSLVIITGDITQRARASQFRDARSFLKKISPTPSVAVPGNHDIPLFNLFGRLFHPYFGYTQYFTPLLESDLTLSGVRVLTLNSTSRWRHVQGSLPVDELKKRLQIPTPQPPITIAALHHPIDCAQHVDEKNLLRGREEVMRLFENGQVDLVLGGHIHDPYVALSDSRYPDVKRKLIISVAGTCLSWRVRANAPNSFHFIEIESGTYPILNIFRYDATSENSFKRVKEYRFQRQAQIGWTTLESSSKDI